MYGLFPVKLKTHIGAPIYPSPGVTPEELSKQVVSAVEELIAQHQQLPGTLTQVWWIMDILFVTGRQILIVFFEYKV